MVAVGLSLSQIKFLDFWSKLRAHGNVATFARVWKSGKPGSFMSDKYILSIIILRKCFAKLGYGRTETDFIVFYSWLEFASFYEPAAMLMYVFFKIGCT